MNEEQNIYSLVPVLSKISRTTYEGIKALDSARQLQTDLSAAGNPFILRSSFIDLRKKNLNQSTDCRI